MSFWMELKIKLTHLVYINNAPQNYEVVRLTWGKKHIGKPIHQEAWAKSVKSCYLIAHDIQYLMSFYLPNVI